MSWRDLFWGLVFIVAANFWVRGVTNHNRRWYIYEYLFGGVLVAVLLIAARQLF